jgi:hypothetical protein
MINSHIKEVDYSEYSLYTIESFTETENAIELIITNKEEVSETDWFLESLNDYFILYDPENSLLMKGVLMNKIEVEGIEKLKVEIIKKQQIIAQVLSTIQHIYVKSFYLSNYSYKLMRGNLSSFLLYGSDRLKELIVELKQPILEEVNQDSIVKFILQNYSKEFTSLNKFQQIAVVKVTIRLNRLYYVKIIV